MKIPSGDARHGVEVPGQRQPNLDKLLRALDTLPERIAATLAEANRSHAQDFEAAADRLTVVLARRVADEIQRRTPEPGSAGPAQVDRLIEMVADEQAALDRLSARVSENSETPMAKDELVHLRQLLSKTLRTMEERMDERDEALRGHLESLERSLTPSGPGGAESRQI